MNSLSLSKQTASKKEIKALAVSLSEQAAENPLLAYVQSQRIKDLATELQANLKAVIVEQLGDEATEIQGAKVSHACRDTYDYSHFPTWVEAVERVKAIEGMMRAAMKPGAIVIDEETGEQMPPAIRKPGTPYPVVKY